MKMETNFLKRLELQGFKSFAQKTTLEFSHPIIAIVGPNGSGKSNIVDAFRWILGEREAKSFPPTIILPTVGNSKPAMT